MNMSAWPESPDDFAEYFEDHGGERDGYAPRKLYARYLGGNLDEAVASGFVTIIEAPVIGARRNGRGWRIELGDGSVVEASAFVLATGNQEPAQLDVFAEAGNRFIANPWGADARAAVENLASDGGDAVIVGTGLTMVDLVLSLDAAGYEGSVLALSRRGLVPRSHAQFEPAPVKLADIPKGSLRALWRWLRRRSANVGWRAAIDSLRPHSHELWRSLSIDQQRQFMRHARPWWDVHRHRIAPQVAATVARMIAEGRLEILAGKILSARDAGDGLDVEFRRRGTPNVQVRHFAYAFNSTGPLHQMERTTDPLLRSLLDDAEVRPDALGIGFEVDGRSRAGERLWALGPLTKARYWEIIAVPDIREQVAAVANDIERELKE